MIKNVTLCLSDLILYFLRLQVIKNCKFKRFKNRVSLNEPFVKFKMLNNKKLFYYFLFYLVIKQLL